MSYAEKVNILELLQKALPKHDPERLGFVLGFKLIVVSSAYTLTTQEKEAVREALTDITSNVRFL